MKNEKIRKMSVAIVGLGVIGAAFAESFKNIGIKTVYGIDIDEMTIRKAEDKGIITKGYLETKEPLEKSDLVIITLYPNLMKSFFINNINNFKENAVITDVVGIKEKIVNDIKPIIEKNRKDIDFIFGHPMAGREKRGIDFADSKVFRDANYIIIKDEKNKKENLTSGSAYNALTIDKLKKFDIIIPPIELQNKFAKRVEKIEKLSFIISSVIFKISETL